MASLAQVDYLHVMCFEEKSVLLLSQFKILKTLGKPPIPNTTCLVSNSGKNFDPRTPCCSINSTALGNTVRSTQVTMIELLLC